ncbi:MAG: terminase large subunit [Anaerolineaceae bacterium]
MKNLTNKPIHPCTQYALDVVEGRVVTGHLELLACKRHLGDLERQGTDGFPWVFDENKANAVYEFFGYCHHIEGRLAGQAIELTPHQKFVEGSIFGWVDKVTRFRRFTKAYYQMGRKNGKSTLQGCNANYLMVGDKEQSPRVYCAAVDKEQARIVYEIAKSIAENSPDICKRLKIRNYKISHITRGGVLMPLSKETKNKDGLNPSGAIIDEYHAHPTSEIYDLLWSARGQRDQMLMIIITTAGVDAEKSPCFKEYELCKQILNESIINERTFVMICELDPDDDEHDPQNWVKANPLLANDPLGMQELVEQHNEAFDSKDPDKIRTFRIKRLDKWVYDSDMGYIGEYLAIWDDLSILPMKSSTPEQRRAKFAELTAGLPCIYGADLAKTIDLTADAFLFYLPSEDKIAICAHGFLPSAAVTRHEKTDKVPYRDWINDGWVTSTEGEVTDYGEVINHLEQSEKDKGWKVLEVAYDPWNGTFFATQLINKGRVCVEIRQGAQTLSEPTKLFRTMIAQGKVIHDGSPLFKWALANAKEVHDNNENIKLNKKNDDDTQRIDPLAAQINTMVRFSVLKEGTKKSIYETRGLVKL